MSWLIGIGGMGAIAIATVRYFRKKYFPEFEEQAFVTAAQRIRSDLKPLEVVTERKLIGELVGLPATRVGPALQLAKIASLSGSGLLFHPVDFYEAFENLVKRARHDVPVRTYDELSQVPFAQIAVWMAEARRKAGPV